MKRGRKSAAELSQLAKRPADLRGPWQIEQTARCGCKGADDLCPCQNENPWPRPFVDWKARAQTAEAQLAEAKAEVERLTLRAEQAEARSGRHKFQRDALLPKVREVLSFVMVREQAGNTPFGEAWDALKATHETIGEGKS